MLCSGSRQISAISSVPYAFSEVFTKVSLGAWTYIFPGTAGIIPDDHAKEICRTVVYFSVLLLDLHSAKCSMYMRCGLMCCRQQSDTGSFISLSVYTSLHANRAFRTAAVCRSFRQTCSRESWQITKVQYSRIKIGYDVTCLTVTALMTLTPSDIWTDFGIGTILAAFTMGKVIGMIGDENGSACKVRILYDKENSIKSYCLRNCETMYITTPATITTGMRIPRIVTSRSNTTAAIKMTATLPYHVGKIPA